MTYCIAIQRSSELLVVKFHRYSKSSKRAKHECYYGPQEGHVDGTSPLAKQLTLEPESDCLIGIATARLDAVDQRNPNQTLTLATPYLLQETAMAHQRDLPFIIFKAEGVHLQGVTARNIYIPIQKSVGPSGGLLLASGTDHAVARAALDNLLQEALARKKRRESSDFWNKMKNLGLGIAAVGAGITALDVYGRPDCFGGFYYNDSECKACGYRLKCKGKKAEDGR
ncbi:MAG: hypothetical protein NTX72_03040 [Candidatus Uhrbacteria bacterium]|nr:hypothetical protein [Candidatus Uhrbacteria bacterium]